MGIAPIVRWGAMVSVMVAAVFVTATAADARQHAVACDGTPSADIDSLRVAAETGPLFKALAQRSHPVACRLEQRDSATTLRYRFADGGSLKWTSDPEIEYADQSACFVVAPSDPIDLLRRVEQTSMGAAGCGIDWGRMQHAARVARKGDRTEAVGSACNCRASMRRHSSGHKMELAFGSAC